MNIAAATRLRLIALVGVLVFAVAGLGVTTLSRLQSKSNTAVPPTLLPHAKHKAAAHSTHPKSHTAAKPATPVHKATHTATKPAPRVTHTPKLLSSLPAPLAHVLAKHRVVVVAIGLSGSAVDQEALGEAKVGATLSDSGFLAVNLTNERQAKAFETLLQGNLDAPAVLVVKRPGTVFVRLDSFADRQLVAQAAANARA
jgi:hypothetical protein